MPASDGRLAGSGQRAGRVVGCGGRVGHNNRLRRRHGRGHAVYKAVPCDRQCCGWMPGALVIGRERQPAVDFGAGQSDQVSLKCHLIAIICDGFIRRQSLDRHHRPDIGGVLGYLDAEADGSAAFRDRKARISNRNGGGERASDGGGDGIRGPSCGGRVGHNNRLRRRHDGGHAVYNAVPCDRQCCGWMPGALVIGCERQPAVDFGAGQSDQVSLKCHLIVLVCDGFIRRQSLDRHQRPGIGGVRGLRDAQADGSASFRHRKVRIGNRNGRGGRASDGVGHGIGGPGSRGIGVGRSHHVGAPVG